MCQFFLFFFCLFFLLFYFSFFFFSFKPPRLHKSFLVFLFFNLTKRGKCAFTPQKYTHLRLHLRKCSCLSRHDRLYRTCVLTRRRIQASQTGLTKYLGSVNGSSGGRRRRFLFLCRLLRLIRRGRCRHRHCIISQVRFIGLTFFRNAAFEELTLRHFEHK